MSLETQIAALVEASNKLTSVINGKILEIDKSVAESISALNNAFPIKYKEFSTRVHYVDCINGDDGNDGLSYGKALRTLKAALLKGDGALSQVIWISKGVHVINDRLVTMAGTVSIEGNNQNHYPNGEWSSDTSSVIHFDKRNNIKSGISTRLFGNLYINNSIITFEGNSDVNDRENTAFYGLGNVGLRLPLFVFDSANRGVMTAGNNYNPFSSLGFELPQFTGQPAYYVKGDGATCILNIDRGIDRTGGMKKTHGSVVVLS